MILAIDTETTGIDFKHGCRPFAISMCDDSGKRYYLDAPVNVMTRQPQWDASQLSRVIARMDRADTLVYHNAKFDIRALESIGVPATRYWDKTHDTVIASHCINSSGPHGLKYLAERYLDIETTDEEDLLDAVRSARRYAKTHKWNYARKGNSQFPAQKSSFVKLDYWLPKAVAVDARYPNKHPWHRVCSKYAVLDAVRTIGLYLVYQDGMRDMDMLVDILDHYEEQRSLLPIVYRMEENGVTLNANIDSEISRYEKASTRYLENAYRAAKADPDIANFNSNKQLAQQLYGKGEFGLPVQHETAGGSPSTKAEHLLELREYSSPEKDEYKFITNLLLSKKFTKAKEYLNGYRDIAVHVDGHQYLHPSFNQTGTATTRFSSSNPNAQNIGKGEDPFFAEIKDAGLNLRRVFGPRSGRIWICIDYSQLQLRIFAYASQETSLIQAFEDGWDAHDYMASRIFNTDKPTKGQRRIAKNCNFGFVFGASPKKIEETARMPGLWDIVTQMFPSAHKFLESNMRQARKDGWVRTMDGYPLTVDRRQPHKATNYIVQGTEGDIVKKAMIYTDKYLKKGNYEAYLTMNVHDELVFDCPRGWSMGHIKKLCSLMEQAGKDVGVITPVDAELVTETWATSKEITRE